MRPAGAQPGPCRPEPLRRDPAEVAGRPAQQSPLLAEAQKNAEGMLDGMLTSLGFQHVTVTFGAAQPSAAQASAAQSS